MDVRSDRLAIGPVDQHQLGPDRRHDHWLGECVLGFGHGQRRPGRERQPELHLERVQPVGDQSRAHNGAVGDSVVLPIESGGLPSGDTWFYSATGLPSGLSIDTSSGQIGGTITGSANAYSVSVTASDGQGASASQSFTWNVSTLSVSNPGTHNGAVGDSVALPIESGGLPIGDSWTYAATGLPSGLSIDTSSGQIGGTITGSANAYSVSVTASDGQGGSASQSFTWNVSTLSVSNPGTHNGAVGDSVALPIESGGLPIGDSWTYAATGLPSGLSINTSSGQIGGTITGSANAYSVSVTASDGQGGSASQSFTWNVSSLSVTNPGRTTAR